MSRGERTFYAEALDRFHAQKAREARRGLDPEIRALARLDRILDGMDADAAARAVEWLYGKFGPEARFCIESLENREAP